MAGDRKRNKAVWSETEINLDAVGEETWEQ